MDIPVVFLGAYITMQIVAFGMYLNSQESKVSVAVVTMLVLLALIWAVGSLVIR